MDRANYPRNTDVVVTIDHQSLNVDPTGEDTWFLIVGEDPRYLNADDADNVKTLAEAEADRDEAIDDAWEDYDEEIGGAETKRSELADAGGTADLARAQLVADALGVMQELQAAAQAVIDNPLLDDDEDRAEFETELGESPIDGQTILPTT